jgi:hypothetical protein
MVLVLVWTSLRFSWKILRSSLAWKSLEGSVKVPTLFGLAWVSLDDPRDSSPNSGLA